MSGDVSSKHINLNKMQNYFIGIYHVMFSTLLKSAAAWSSLQRCESRQNKI